ncbi:hypothetical protein DFH08DRAFT_812248 [Mycena albidolilacea]|uniref:Uncharacterized protein n=1 Tax=Mycena albidolilacea TaxID=1033008 RepID=A0AAD6ZUC4_9AGAR|nr:hypothetical protein DFH08DRAFT_812248 [Mycena albidolilacea]
MDEEGPTEPQVASESADDERGSPPTQAFTMINEAAPKDPSGNFNTQYGQNLPEIWCGAPPERTSGHEANVNGPDPWLEVVHDSSSLRGRRCLRTMAHGNFPIFGCSVGTFKETLLSDFHRHYHKHPNLFQLYGIASTGRLHAAAFHDDLVSHTEFAQKYEDSHFSEVFFWAFIYQVEGYPGSTPPCTNIFGFSQLARLSLQNASEYISLVCGSRPDWTDYTACIRPSAGVLIIELTLPEFGSVALVNYGSSQFRQICQSNWGPSVISGPEYQDSLEFAFAPYLDVHDSGWQTEDPIIEGYWPA